MFKILYSIYNLASRWLFSTNRHTKMRLFLYSEIKLSVRDQAILFFLWPTFLLFNVLARLFKIAFFLVLTYIYTFLFIPHFLLGMDDFWNPNPFWRPYYRFYLKFGDSPCQLDFIYTFELTLLLISFICWGLCGKISDTLANVIMDKEKKLFDSFFKGKEDLYDFLFK